jgi:DNA-binding CsgD family transcriptional regulator
MVQDDRTMWEKIEQIATQRANRQVAATKWNLNILIVTYTVLAIAIFLRLEGIAIEIVSIITLVGLATIWFMTWRRRRRMYRDLYHEELSQLKELYERGGIQVLTSSLLSKREMEILSYIAGGCANKEIAFILNISSNTVKNHVSVILRKLNVKDRTQAALLAMNQGWLSSQLGISLRPQ